MQVFEEHVLLEIEFLRPPKIVKNNMGVIKHK